MSEESLDLQGLPTAACPACGCDWLLVPMKFDPETYDVAMWGTEGTCFGCGSRVTVCTPVDSISGMDDRRSNDDVDYRD